MLQQARRRAVDAPPPRDESRWVATEVGWQRPAVDAGDAKEGARQPVVYAVCVHEQRRMLRVLAASMATLLGSMATLLGGAPAMGQRRAVGSQAVERVKGAGVTRGEVQVGGPTARAECARRA